MRGLRGLTWQQKAALACIDANYGQASEQTISEGGFAPRLVMRSLERRGLAEKVCYLDDHAGYLYRRVSRVPDKDAR